MVDAGTNARADDRAAEPNSAARARHARWGLSVAANLLLAALGLLLAALAAAQGDPIGVVTDLYVVDAGCCGLNNGGVLRVTNLQGTPTQVVVSRGGSFVAPVGIARDAANGDLYVADPACCGGSNGGVIRLTNVQGTPTQIIITSGGNFVVPSGIARDPASGDLYVTDPECCGGNLGGVVRVTNLQGTPTQIVVSRGGFFDNPFGITRDSATGDLYIADFDCCGGAQGGVIRVTNVQGTPTQILLGRGGSFVNPSGIAREAATGNLYIADAACCESSNGGVIRLANVLGTPTQVIVSQGGSFAEPAGIARDAATGDLYVADAVCCTGISGVVRVTNLQGTPTQVVVSRGGSFIAAAGIALVVATYTPTTTRTSTPAATPTVTPSATATATHTPTPLPTVTGTLPPPTTSTPTAASTPTASGTPTTTPSALCVSVGAICHADLSPTGNGATGSLVVQTGVVERGPCARANCVQTTTTGSFQVQATVTALRLGEVAAVRLPVANALGQPLGFREVVCQPAKAAGVATCTGTVAEPGVGPQLGATVLVLVTRQGTPTITPTRVGVVVFPAPPLQPLPPPPALLRSPPLPPPLPPPGGPPLPRGVAPPAGAGVPVIPEADSLPLLGAALLALAARVIWRRR